MQNIAEHHSSVVHVHQYIIYYNNYHVYCAHADWLAKIVHMV